MRRLLILIGVWMVLVPVTAQYDILEFRWDIADVALSYPATWEEPFAVQQFGVETVILAESDARNPEREPEIPVIVITLIPATETDPMSQLESRLSDFNIGIDRMLSTSVLINDDAPLASGISRDNNFFGMGTSIQLGDNILTIVGRVPVDQQQQFESIFNVVTRSMVLSGEFGNSVTYGVVWGNIADEDDFTFIELQDIAIDDSNQIVYTIDVESGLMRLDMVSGRLLEVIPNPEFITPSDIAVGLEGVVYVSDSDCPCIHVYQDNEWGDVIEGFGFDSPQSIETDSNGALYATFENNETVGVVLFTPDGEITLGSDEPFFGQPLLARHEDQLYAYDERAIYQFDGTQFVFISTLDIDTTHNFFEVAPDGTYLLGLDNLIDLYTPGGILIESIDLGEASLGTTISGLSRGQDDILYVVINSDGTSEVLALSQQVPDASFGLPILAPYRISGSFLNADNMTDKWFIDGVTNEILTIEVQGFSTAQDFDYSVTLIAPDGTEVVTVEDDTNLQLPFTRSLSNIQLTTNGIYTVKVDQIIGEGIYDMTIITPTLLVHDGTLTERYGIIPESYPTERWLFEGRGQTTLNITAEAIDSTQFIPQIALYNLQGELVETNLEILDNSAQITEFTVPFNNTYIIDVSRLEGVGRYRLTIENVEPSN